MERKRTVERKKISDGIADEVRTRVQQRLALPFSLTTPAMAKYFGTSLTPVRQAVERLVAEGILEKGANQRLALAPQWRAGSRTGSRSDSRASSRSGSRAGSGAGSRTALNKEAPQITGLSNPPAVNDAVSDGDGSGDTVPRGRRRGVDVPSRRGTDPESTDLVVDGDADVSWLGHVDATLRPDWPLLVREETLGGGCVSNEGTREAREPASSTAPAVEVTGQWDKGQWYKGQGGMERTRMATGPAEAERRRRLGIRRRLVEETVRLSLLGQAAFLREQAWATELGIGRGQLRQVLSEMAGAGFVRLVPRRGWQVRPFDSQAMLCFLDVREVLECLAVDLGRDRLDAERLREMWDGNPEPVRSAADGPSDGDSSDRSLSHEIASDRSGPLNNEIHDYLVSCAGNPYIADFFQRHSPYYSQLFEMAAVKTGWRDEMAGQHREILAALMSRDWERAKRALAEHIRSQRPVVQSLLNQIRSE